VTISVSGEFVTINFYPEFGDDVFIQNAGNDHKPEDHNPNVRGHGNFKSHEFKSNNSGCFILSAL
jgi:hypothetical protein